MDPYYQKKKNFYAIPLAPLLNKLFASHANKLEGSELMFEALDGYSVRLPGKLALDPAAHLAFAEVDTNALAPIGEQKVPAGPLYLVWKGDDLTDLKTHPRPWGLSRITLLSSSDSYQHITPPCGFTHEYTIAQAGFAYFQKDSLHCHANNQEGGKLGPDLNVPQNILAYRDEAQVRAFIKNPRQFRYSNMPPHPDLSESDLDGIIAYLKLMGQHQHDPEATPLPLAKP
jgi:cytochrome c2